MTNRDEAKAKVVMGLRPEPVTKIFHPLPPHVNK